MSIPANFDECACAEINVESTWKGVVKTTSAESQTPKEMYQFYDAEVQTGVRTEIVEDVAGKGSGGLTVLDFLCENHSSRCREEWEHEIRSGKVSVDGDMVTHSSMKIEVEQYIEYINIKSDRETEISKSDFGCQADDVTDITDKDNEKLMKFVDKVLPLFEQELDINCSSTAFDGYNALREEAVEDIQLWNIMTVDLEKHKVVYPDWSKGDHFPGVITRCHTTRNKERIYDIEPSDGRARLCGVREEYIRALSSVSDNFRQRRGEAKVRFYEGMRLHACVRGSSKGPSRFLPGRVITAHRNGTADVECEGGVLKNGLTQEDVLVGLQEGQEVEARRPVLVDMQGTGVSWSCNGSIVAAAYGNRDVSGWSDSPGAVCTWSVFNRDFNPSCPDLVLDHSICLMCVRFHPSSPSLVAAGSFNGEVVVWDLNHPDSPIAVSPIAEECHNEPIMALDWVRDPSTDSFLLSSLGADGKFLVWSLEQGFSKPCRGSVLNKTKISKRSAYPSAHGGTSFSFSGGSSSRRPKWVVMGQEGGSLVRAQASRVMSLVSDTSSEKRGVGTYPSIRRGGDTFRHEAHIGPVNSVQCSPFHRSVFLTGGQDGAVRLYHMLEQAPLRSWEPSPPAEEIVDSEDMDMSFASISCVCFSPTRPAVFAAASRDGHIYVFDLTVSQSGPISTVKLPPIGATMTSIAEIEANGRRETPGTVARATSLCFNGKQRDLIAACDQSGRVFIWKMGWSLSNRKQNEQSVLDRLGSVTVDDDSAPAPVAEEGEDVE